MNKIVQNEAMRVASGIIAARHHKSPADATILLDGYMAFAREQKVKETQAWFYLFGAAVHWAGQLVKETAGERDVEIEQVLHEIGTAAALWATR